MPFSVQVDQVNNIWEDISYKRSNHYMYSVLLGGKPIGQVAKIKNNSWWGISYQNPQNNWLGEGFGSREQATVFILRVSGYYKNNRVCI